MTTDKKNTQTFISSDSNEIHIHGNLRGGGSPKLLDILTKAVLEHPTQKVLIDISNVIDIDSLGASLLSELLVRGHLAGKDIDYVNANPHVQKNLAGYFYPAPKIRYDESTTPRIEFLGGGLYNLWDTAGELLILTSETVYWTVVALWRGDGHRKGAVTAQALSIGVGSLPIVLMISFLIGIVLVLQSAGLLKQFGANIFIANGLVVAMFAEMGPLMTAILLAGRSGSAIAAEIATMTVTEEIDALKTMALNPLRFIVVPKVWGISLTMPLLSIIASIVGVFGGFIVSVASLDLSPQAFINQAANSLVFKDIVTGLVKSLVFAWLIVLLAAFYGFRVKGGAEGVGRATTASVVASLFAVIVADALLGLLFYL